jgi:hypothetical protein
MRNLKKSLLAAFASFTLASFSFAGQLTIGAQYQGWNLNTIDPYSGWEILAPVSLAFNLDKGWSLYGQGEFASGHYSEPSQTLNLNHPSDTILGNRIDFKSFGVASVLNVEFNLPTGDPAWEAQQFNANIPTAYVESRYRSRGFGINAMYGLAFPMGEGQLGAAAGYLYSGKYSPDSSAPANDLKLGDSMFFSLNHVLSLKNGQKQIIRASSYVFLSTQETGVDVFRMGPNFNASFSWINPKAFSIELGGQYYLPAQRLISGSFATEPQNSYGPRFYVAPSYSFGDFTLAARGKYILANGYASGEVLYNAGGFMVGVEPALKLPMDEGSALRLSASFDYIVALDAGIGVTPGTTANIVYNRWTFGTSYEIKL